MYKPAARADGKNLEFIEIYNTNPFFHDIGGYRIEAGNLSYTFAAGTTIPANTYWVIAAGPADMESVYGLTNVLGPYTGSLKKSGTLQLFDEVGSLLLTVPYSNLHPWPVAADGTGHSIVLARATYGEEDPRAWAISDAIGGSPGRADTLTPTPLRSVVINEILTHTESPGTQQFIELYNHSTQAADLAGCILTDDVATNQFVVPAGTTIPAGGFVAFDQATLGFGLPGQGGTVYLLEADRARVLDAVQCEAQANGVSLGRWPDGADEFYPMSVPTPGGANSAILIGDIVINEIMFDPISRDDDDQYVELYNQGTNSISLANWRFVSGLAYVFPTNVVLAPDSYLVLARNTTNLLAKYSNLNAVNTLGNFTGKLSHGGERLALASPQRLVETNHHGILTTNIVYVVEDEVTYGTGGRWGQWAAGGGSSLELIDPRANHRLAANWADSDETQKSRWVTIETTGTLDNGASYDPSIDRAQIGLLDVGECLVDNVEVHAGTTGANLVANPDFESGLGSWSLQGCHIRSSLESTGYASSQSLHIRCSDRLWTGDNSCEATLLSNSLGSGQTATLRFKARWLHGWPEVLLRLNGNWLEATGPMPVPPNLGTPGARNSQATTNAGPAIYEVTHTPTIPAALQSVVVTARVQDPDGVQNLTLNYRIDPATTYTAVPMTDDGTGGDAIAGDGIFSATIPGQNANVIAAFYVTATDGAAASSRFPALVDDHAPVREALVMFGDSNPQVAFGVYHMWISRSNVQRWSSLSDLSNESHDLTFVNGSRVIYNAQGRFAGSPYHQGFNTPNGNLCHYKLTFPEDDKFLGATSFNKLHQPGNGAGDDATEQREQMANGLLRALGVPWLNRRYVLVYVNGNRRGPIMEDTQTPDGDVVKERFPKDSGGFLFKMQPWFEFAPAPSGQSISFNNASWCTLNVYNSGGKKKMARYRYNYLVRRTPDSANNFTNVFSLVDAANSYGTANYVANMENLADMENWMRVFAANHAAGNWDAFGCQNEQNLYGYIGTQGTRYSLLMWDFNIVFGNSGSWAAGQNLFTVNGADPNTANIYRQPAFRRMYWRALQELVDGPLDVSISGPLMDAKYNAFLANGVSAQSPSVIKTYLTSARSSIASQIAAENTTSFTVNTPTVSQGAATITGTAPFVVKTIQVNGTDWPVTWNNVTAWSLKVPLAAGNNMLTVVGVDMHGDPVAGALATVPAQNSGVPPSPVGAVVINEIMYQPRVPDSQYVELLNTASDWTFDLSGWEMPELAYTFPAGALIAPGGTLVLTANRPAFAAAYGATIPVFDTFNGHLRTDAQTLSLVRPGPTLATNEAVAEVRFESAAPWPAAAAGAGSSLQLIDASQDISRVGNWATATTNGSRPPPQWQHVTITGAATKSTLLIGMVSAGDVYLDDLVLVAGSVPEVGPNLLTDGDFESPLSGNWTISSNMTDSAISTDVKHSGSASLHVVASSGGALITLAIWQDTTTLVTNNTYTLSYWYLPSDNGSGLLIRLWGSAPNSGQIYSLQSFQPPPVASSLVTPGAPNSVAASLPSFPPLWLNEVQSDNLTGISTAAGQRAPWVELYNAGASSIPLDGLYLSDDYANLTKWAFPAGTSLDARSFKVVFTDGATNLTTAAELHAGFTLASGTGSIALSRLVNGYPQVLDYLNYVNLPPDRGYGSIPDGQPFNRKELFYATPGSTNNGALAPITVVINEWMAANTSTLPNPLDNGNYDDWFELYNSSTNTVDLSGCFLSDAVTNLFKSQIPAGYTIPPQGFLLVWADGKAPKTSGPLQVNFRLSKSGSRLLLTAPTGVVVDSINFGPQTTDISEGRYPDGGPNYYPSTPTPGAPNASPNTPPVIVAWPSDQTIYSDETFSFSVHAIDADQPAQTLTYTLDPGAPAGMSLNPQTGLLTWAPLATQAPSTNVVTVRVTDNGQPPLSTTESFKLTVISGLRLVAATQTATTLTLSWTAASGKTYRLEYKDDLNAPAWLPAGPDQVGDNGTVSVSVDLTVGTARFFRLEILQ